MPDSLRYWMGRRMLGGRTQITLTTTLTQFVAASPYRCVLVLPVSSAGTVGWQPSSAGTAAPLVDVVAGSPPIIITWWDHGSLVQAPWSGILSVGSDLASIWEGQLSAGDWARLDREYGGKGV